MLVPVHVLLAYVVPDAAAEAPTEQPADVTAYRDRLRAEPPTAKATEELARLAREYGEVAIRAETADAWFEAARADLPVEALEAIAFAKQALARTTEYDGLLPVGTYETDRGVFEVRVGAPLLNVTLATDWHEAPTCGPCCHGGDCEEWEPDIKDVLTPPQQRREKREERRAARERRRQVVP